MSNISLLIKMTKKNPKSVANILAFFYRWVGVSVDQDIPQSKRYHLHHRAFDLHMKLESIIFSWDDNHDKKFYKLFEIILYGLRYRCK